MVLESCKAGKYANYFFVQTNPENLSENESEQFENYLTNAKLWFFRGNSYRKEMG